MNWLKNRTVLGTTCILLSLVLCFGIAPLLNRDANETIPIVRVVQDVSKGELITAADVKLMRVGSYQLPDQIIQSDDQVIGQYATVDLKVDDYLFPSKLSPVPLDAYLARLDGKKQALSISIKSLAAGLSGKLQAGDIISLIAADYGDLRTTTLPPELQYVEVLSVTASSGKDTQPASYEQPDESENELPSTLTVLVVPQQAILLSDIENKGKLHAALVYRGDPTTAQQFLDAQDAYFAALLSEEDNADE